MKTKLCKEVCRRCWEMRSPGSWDFYKKAEARWRDDKVVCIAVHKVRRKYLMRSRVSIFEIPDCCFYRFEHMVMGNKK